MVILPRDALKRCKLHFKFVIDVSFDYVVDEVNNFFACGVPSNVINKTTYDVVSAINKVDCIPLEFLKNIFPYIPELILELVNPILTISMFPLLQRRLVLSLYLTLIQMI